MFKDSVFSNNIIEKFISPVIATRLFCACVIDKDGMLKEMNDELCDFTGYLRNEIIGKHFSIMLTGANREKEIAKHCDFMNSGSYGKDELGIRHKSGRTLYVQLTNIKFNDEEGNLFRAVAFYDITAKKQLELLQPALMEMAHKAALLENYSDLFKLLNEYVSNILPSEIFYVTMHREATKGIEYSYFSANDSMKKDLTEDIIARIWENATPVILKRSNEAEGRMVGLPIGVKGKLHGAVVFRSTNENFYFTKNDLSMCALLMHPIITAIQRRLFEEELNSAKSKIDEADRVKSAFLAQVSHEVRTPLNAILCFNSLIKEEINQNSQLDKNLKGYFDIVEKSGNRLIRTIDLMVSAAQLKAQQYSAQIVNLQLADEIISPLVDGFRILARDKGIKLNFENELQNSRVLCDRYSVGQMLIHLVDNAIKFTDKGSVKVKLHNDKGHIRVDIADTGKGISPEYFPHLFDNFSQEEIGYHRRFEGNGLGLFLVNEYAKINNASVFVESEKDKGSKFSIIFD